MANFVIRLDDKTEDNLASIMDGLAIFTKSKAIANLINKNHIEAEQYNDLHDRHMILTQKYEDLRNALWDFELAKAKLDSLSQHA